MNSKLLTICTSALLMALIAGPCYCASVDSSKGKWVEATGVAAGEDAAAFSAARLQAMRNALQSACGVFLSSRTTSAGASSARESILAKVDGYVSKVEILSKKVTDGQTTVTINALVQTKKAADDFTRLRHAYRQANRPQVAVVIAEVTHDMFEKYQKQDDISLTLKKKLDAERRRYADELNAAAEYQKTDGVNVTGRFRRGRPRPRNFSAWSLAQQRQWLTETAQEDYANAVAKLTGSVEFKRRRAKLEKVSESVKSDGKVQAVIERYLVKNDIKVVNLTQVKSIRRRDVLLAGLSDDPKEIAAVKARLHANILVTGTATARRISEVKVGQGKLYRYKAKLDVRATNANTGMVLLANTFSVTINSAMPTGGVDEALEKVAQKAAKTIANDLADSWNENATRSKDVSLTVSGMNFSHWLAFKKAAVTWPGVKSVKITSITAGVGQIDFLTDLTPEQLAEKIVNMKEPAIELSGFDGSELKGKIKE